MASLPPVTQLAGNNRVLFESYFNLADVKRSGRVDGATAAQFLKKSQLRETTLHKIWNLSDPNATGFLDKQGFFLALRLVALCQSGKEPAVANLSLSDPLPKLAGIEVPTTSAVNLWTIDVQERAKFDLAFQSQLLVNGLLTGDKAKPLMLTSKLPVNTLGKIWSLSDIDCDGNLDKDEFAVAMKLITLAQSGETLPPSLPSSLIPPSKVKQAPSVSSLASKSSAATVQPLLATTTLSTSMAGSSGSGTNSPMHSASPLPHSSPLSAKKQQPLATASTSFPEWIITTDVKSKYDTYFQGIDKDHDGYVTGEEAKGLLSASNLPVSQLAHIWNLCDISKTGRLNAEQFALAMFLVAEKVRGKPLPNELTPAMIPPSLRQTYAASVDASTASSSTVAATASSSTSLSGLVTFSQGLGSVSDLDTSTTTTTSSAWGAPVISASNGGSEGFGFGSDFSAIKELDHISNEIDSIRKEKSQLSEDIKTKQELIQQRKGEINDLQTDVETAMKQRESLERDKAEAQAKLDHLDSEKANYEGQIAELKQKCQDEQEEIGRLKAQLSEQETSKQVQSEQLENLREQLETLRKEEKEYKVKVDASKAELDKLQKTNLALQSDISQVRQKIDSLKEEHSNLTNQLTLFPAVTTPSSTASSSVINIHDVGQLSSELHVPHISEPDAISARATAGSSSPVSSISGFSTNSHLDDGGEDNTQSSSSLAAAAGSGGVGIGGGAKDDKKLDPFASTSSGTGGSDLFSAFSVSTAAGSSDPFFGAGTNLFSGKPSDVSAFDPFGISDPFKSSGSASASTGGGGAGDFFGSDPFSSTTTASGSSPLPPSSGAPPPTSTADPFSGQDPFSSDPFASTTTTTSSSSKAADQTSAWGGASPFAADPFGSQQNAQTPTDPFGSGDPFGFGDDPFASKSADSTSGKGGDSINPFQKNSARNSNSTPTKSKKREEVVVPEALAKPGPRAKEWEHIAWAKRESEREEALRKKRQQEEQEDLEKAIRDSMKS